MTLSMSNNEHQTMKLAEDNEQKKIDAAFMAQAYALAQQAEAINEIPVGAIVVANGEIIGQGYNQSITLNDPSAHAEMIAIRQAGQYLNNYRLIDCTLYVTLEPCPMCAGLLVHSRINRLVFGAPDAKTGAAGSVMNLANHAQLNHQITIESGLMAEQCSQLLSDFFKRRRKEIKQQKAALKQTLQNQ